MSDLFDLPFEDEDQPALAPAGPPTPIASRRVLTVTELTVRVRDRLESEFYEVWVEGELSNCRLWNTGHLYFTLKDAASQMRGFMFRSALRYLKFKPADGLRVVARGKISVYEPKGEYQLVCEHLEPQGLGALQLAFDQLKKRLQEEGLFDRRAQAGAAGASTEDRDRDVARRRRDSRHHQGAAAAVRERPDRHSARARAGRRRGTRDRPRPEGRRSRPRRGRRHRRAWRRIDRGSLGVQRRDRRARDRALPRPGHLSRRPRNRCHDRRLRGGSSGADAVGCRRDRRLGEGRVRARESTGSAIGCARPPEGGFRPSAGACTCSAAVRRSAAFPGASRCGAAMPRSCRTRSRRVMRSQAAGRERRLQQLQRRLDACDLGKRLAAIAHAPRRRGRAAPGGMARRRHHAESRLRSCAGRLETLSPLAVLARGYAVCWNADRTRVVRDAAAAAPGDRVRVTLAQGELDCEVQGVKSRKSET